MPTFQKMAAITADWRDGWGQRSSADGQVTQVGGIGDTEARADSACSCISGWRGTGSGTPVRRQSSRNCPQCIFVGRDKDVLFRCVRNALEPLRANSSGGLQPLLAWRDQMQLMRKRQCIAVSNFRYVRIRILHFHVVRIVPLVAGYAGTACPSRRLFRRCRFIRCPGCLV